MSHRDSRRQFIKYAGAGTIAALAGCTGGGGGGGGNGGTDGGGSGGSDGGGGDSGGSGGGGGNGDDTGTTTGGMDEETVKVGILLPFTGELAAYGGYERRGVETAVQLANEAGGINGREVEALVQGTQATSQGAVQGLQTLNSQGIHVLYGPTSSTVSAVRQPLTELGILTTNSAGTTFLDDKGGGVDGFHNYRAVGSDSDIGRARATWCQENEWETAAICHLDSTQSASAAGVFRQAAQVIGIEIVEDFALAPTATSYRSELSTIQSADPDVVICNIGTEKTPLFVTNYRELGLDIPTMIGNEVLGPKIIEEVGPQALRGFMGIDPAAGPNFDQFSEVYQRVQDREVEPFSNASFDGAMTMLLALEASGEVSREAPLEHVRGPTGRPGEKFFAFEDGKAMIEEGTDPDYEGAVSNCNYDEFGDAVPPLVVAMFEEDSWQQQVTYVGRDLAMTKGELAEASG
jgi:ABC-type branched-subunit amino acid transport system substrate-binding protein